MQGQLGEEDMPRGQSVLVPSALEAACSPSTFPDEHIFQAELQETSI